MCNKILKNKKGSITIFLACMLSVFLLLVCACMRSVRTAAARTQIACSMDVGLYSLFGQFDKALFKDYDLLYIDGSCGGGSLSMGKVYDNLVSYVKPVLKQNSQHLSLKQGGFTGYSLATDQDGEVFYYQVVQFMKNTLGAQGIEAVVDRFEEKKSKTQDAAERGTQEESKGTISNYDDEMSSAAAQSEEKQKNAETDTELNSGTPTPSSEVTNPITVIKQVRKMGILQLVLPQGKSLSGASIVKSSLLSGREKQTGFGNVASITPDNSYLSSILFQEYLMEKLGCFTNPKSGTLKYQLEYLIAGKTSDEENLAAVANKLLLIREGVNLATINQNAEMLTAVTALSMAIASTFLVPPAGVVIEAALILCWSFAESVLDVRELLDGGRIPLVKTVYDWQISLENLADLLSGLDSMRKNVEGGMSYEDYLQVLILAENKSTKLQRGMDMIEQSIKVSRPDFLLDSCIYAVEASLDVNVNGKKQFNIVRQYSYDQ